MSLARILAGRVLAALGTLLGVSVLLFAGCNLVPGDTAIGVLGPGVGAAQIQQFDHDAGLDRPIVAQYLSWLGHAVRGDLGQSWVQSEPVSSVIGSAFGATLALVAIAGGLTVLGSLAVGLYAGLRPGGAVDTVLTAASITAVSIPVFVLASLAVLVFATWLHWLPAVSLVPYGGTPFSQPDILVMPALVLASFGTAWAGRLIRASVLDASQSPHVEASRLAGLSEWSVVRRHLLPSVAGPVAQTLAWLVGALVGGTAVVERVFAYPGLSQLLISSVTRHDTPVVEGVGLMLAAIILAAMIVADLIGLLADPRVRTAR